MQMTAQPRPFEIAASTPWQTKTKQLMDIVVSAVGIVLLVPLFAIVALAILLEDGGSVFYRQPRVGRGGALFKIDKFRSMQSASGGSNLTVAGDPRVTRVGAVLRRTKLDELPQLANVLWGEMSLVGPRPETPDLMAQYSPFQRELILSVRPGMTDYASVVLRDESTLLAGASDPATFYRERLIPLKFELCSRYLQETGLLTDLRVILATLWGVFHSAGRNPFLDPSLSSRLVSQFATGNDNVS